jgi:hypothetical protein
MEASKLGISVTVIGIAVGVITPIVWDVYKTSSALEVQMIALDKLVEPSQNVKGLEIRYGGELIPSVSRMTLLIVNTGRNPLREKDFSKPLVLKVPDNARLLEFSIEKTSREGMTVQPKVTPGKAGMPARSDKSGKSAAPVKPATPGEVALRFSVLNPKDYVRVSLLTAGHATGLKVVSDVVGVGDVPFVDRTMDFEGGRPKIPGSVVTVGFFSAAALFGALFGGLPALRRGSRARAALRDDQFAIPAHSERDVYLRYVSTDLDFLPGAELRSLKTYLGALPGVVDDASRQEFDRLVRKAVAGAKPENAPFVVAITLGLIGAAYVVLRLSLL